MATMLMGLLPSREHADAAIDELENAGFNPKDISVIMRKENQEDEVAVEHADGSEVTGNTASGAVTGGIIGGLAGLLIGVGAIVIPGIGALLIGGPLAAALGLSGAAATAASGAVTGALAGGLVGALVSLGVPEEEARSYEEKIKTGGILLAIPANNNDEDEVRRILEDHGAERIRSVSTRE